MENEYTVRKNIIPTLCTFLLKQGLGDSLETTQAQGVQRWESPISLSDETDQFLRLLRIANWILIQELDYIHR
ncbi:MAG: hypothetical protein Fur0025_32800 [Oscillatoriaceae cyanobacterium]